MNTNILKLDTALLICFGGKKVKPCQTFREASDLLQSYIQFNNLGSSDFYKKKNAGMIMHPTKGIIANVSYNGRVWESDGSFKLNRKEIVNLQNNDLL